MAENNEKYTEGGAPSNGQVASVKIGTVDLSLLNDGVGTAIADVVNLFDLNADEQVITGGFEVLEATDDTVFLDIGLDGGSTFGAAEDGTSVTVLVIDTVPAVGVSGKVTIEVNGAAATKGRIKVWLVVANYVDPAEPVPASVRVPPIV